MHIKLCSKHFQVVKTIPLKCTQHAYSDLWCQNPLCPSSTCPASLALLYLRIFKTATCMTMPNLLFDTQHKCSRYDKLVENNEQFEIHSTRMPQQWCHLLTSAVNSHHAASMVRVWTNALAFKHLILWWALEAVKLCECYLYYIFCCSSLGKHLTIHLNQQPGSENMKPRIE